ERDQGESENSESSDHARTYRDASTRSRSLLPSAVAVACADQRRTPSFGQPMQVFVILAFALIGFTVNFFWDRTVRRRQAAALAAARRKARPRALPPALDEQERERRVPDAKLRFFIDLTRQTFI